MLGDTAAPKAAETRTRTVPEELRFRPSTLAEILRPSLYLHVLEKTPESGGARTSVLGLLLPSPLDFQFTVHVPSGSLRCHIHTVGQNPRRLEHEELCLAATWSMEALALFRAPVPPQAGLVDPAARPWILHEATGEYSLGEPVGDMLADEPGAPGEDDVFCVAVPLDADAEIDWQFLRFGLRILATGGFPQFAWGYADGRGYWLDGETGVRIPLREAIVSARVPCGRQQRRMRRQFFTDITPPEAPAQAPAEVAPGADAPAPKMQLGAKQLIHRSFAMAGASPEILPCVDDGSDFSLGAYEDCEVVPMTAALAESVFVLPTILWHVEVYIHMIRLHEDFRAMDPPVHIDIELLRLALTRVGVTVGQRWCSAYVPAPVLAARRVAGSDNGRLEYLGDALLKLVSRLLTFYQLPHANEGELSKASDNAVTNDFLCTVANRLALPDLLLSRRFTRRAPTLAHLRLQEIPWKAAAGSVEAMMAAIWLTSRCHPDRLGCPEALRALSDFVRYHTCADFFDVVPLGTRPTVLGGWPMSYAFQALKLSEAQRLAFLGDAILQGLVSEHLFFRYPNADEGTLAKARSWLIGNTYLARRSAAWLQMTGDPGLYSLLSVLPGGRSTAVILFLNTHVPVRDAGTDLRAAVLGREPRPPKCFGDLYEVVVGYRFQEFGGNLQQVWELCREDFEIPSGVLDTLLEQHTMSLPSFVLRGVTVRQHCAAHPGISPQDASKDNPDEADTWGGAPTKPGASGGRANGALNGAAGLPPKLDDSEAACKISEADAETSTGDYDVEGGGEAAKAGAARRPGDEVRSCDSGTTSTSGECFTPSTTPEAADAGHTTCADVAVPAASSSRCAPTITVHVLLPDEPVRTYLFLATTTLAELKVELTPRELRGVPNVVMLVNHMSEPLDMPLGLIHTDPVSIAFCAHGNLNQDRLHDTLYPGLDMLSVLGPGPGVQEDDEVRNAKSALNELVMRHKGAPLSKDDIIYTNVGLPSGPFQMNVRVEALESWGQSLAFTGSACPTKKEAEWSAAKAALWILVDCPVGTLGLKQQDEPAFEPSFCSACAATLCTPEDEPAFEPSFCSTCSATLCTPEERTLHLSLDVHYCATCKVSVSGTFNYQQHCLLGHPAPDLV